MKGSASQRLLFQPAQQAAVLAAFAWRILMFVLRPHALGHGAGGRLDVSSRTPSADAKVKSRAYRGGGNAAMVDGSVQGGAAAVGVWYAKDHPLNFATRITGRADNNRAELAALFWALLRHPRGLPFTVYTDSTHVVAVMCRLGKEGPVRSVSALEWAVAAAVLVRSARLSVRKVKAHNNNPSNDMADSIAKLALRSAAEVWTPDGVVIGWWQRICFTFSMLWRLANHIGDPIAVSAAKNKSAEVPKSTQRCSSETISLRAPQPLSNDCSVTRVLGIDCEMVGVGADGLTSALARVCIVNQYGNVLLDTYACPAQEVTDYRTPYSGIRKEDIMGAPSVEDVQLQVANLVKGRIIVGHGLENDLEVLSLSHPHADTRNTSKIAAFCYKRKKGRPRKLRDLAAYHLGLDIQRGEHSPIDDARAALYLYLSFEKGTFR